MGLKRVWDSGRAARRNAAQSHTLSIISSMGNRLACASMTSEAEVHNAPVMAVIAIRCTVESLRATPIDPLDIPESTPQQTGVNHMSAA